MVKKNKRKILFIICEGTSDDVTLHRSIDNFINSGIRYIKVETTDGDMAYKENISEENCIEYVNNIVTDFKKKMFLFPTDFLAIIHIIDTDGSFMKTDSIYENINSNSYEFINDTLHTPSKEKLVERFSKKKKVYQKLFDTKKLGIIDYYKFYFSRNLEHSLYNLPNATVQQKIDLSNDFDNKYKNNRTDFYNVLSDIMFDVPNSYTESWNYIFTDNNSIKRCSNIRILLDFLKS